MLGNRYQIITQLGRGGFGTTFIAIDTQRPGNPRCVVKQFKPLATDPFTLQVAKRLFDQEAEILETLGKHDQIPQLLAYFEENQEFYLIQEFVEGEDLTQELPSKTQLSEAVVITLLKDILEVLAFVHQHKVIHRDIKPSNIRRRRSDGKIVLIDFGAVKQVKGLQVNSQGQTFFTVPIGTHGYMPSEQAKGDPKLSSDIYAVGIIGIQALTGINPVPHTSGSLPTHPNTGEIVWRDRVKVSSKLADVVDKMVRYDYRQRYLSANEALQALTRLSPKRRPWKVLLGVGIAAAISIIILLALHFKEPDNVLIYKTYDNSSYGIKIKYPETWSVQNLENPITGEVVTFWSPKKSQENKAQENLTIKVLENYSGTLDQSTDLFKSEIKKNLSDAQIIEQGSTILANKAAGQLVYTGKNDGKSLKNFQVWTLKGDRVYILTYTAAIDDYNKFMQTAEAMIKSLEISDSSK
ncbi:protein kinase [Aetokthonos hydrillicola Thurmond2011]|uniref:non-specific serine/threonine protein kinase n=1 Tax=Aetokthonos hydrillicola Thurmond2011 TaxID=2712845 RepID=A0AAP5I7L0_9CYAN|nr:protein kinase [Aetokthonos hydrillicola CCALA 1050]MBW4585565.1 protein kinase [Aetokthonos hydrillicola CCALA 1050]MDR9896189.1 protein kinase [Aetokthonos hydrillicola Thurmond2011]